MVFEVENALRIKTFIESSKGIAETNRTHRIRWSDGSPNDLPVLRILVNLLTYNFDNIRLEYQLIEEINKRGKELDFENNDDREEYAAIFKEKLKGLKTQKLKKDIANTQQNTPVIITHGGVILNGNRRFLVIKELYEEELVKSKGKPEKFHYMDVVRLPSGLPRKTLLAIQAQNQMYIEDIVQYRLINLALGIKKFKGAGFANIEIANMLNNTEDTIIENQIILSMIDKYLEENNRKNMYAVIDKNKMWDHFLELRKQVKNHGNYTGLEGSDLLSEINTMRSLAYKWLKNNIDPEMIKMKKVMKSREVIRNLRDIVHKPEYKDTIKKVLEQKDNSEGKKTVHRLMDAAIRSAHESKVEERVYKKAERITILLKEMERIIKSDEQEIDTPELIKILSINQKINTELINYLSKIKEK